MAKQAATTAGGAAAASSNSNKSKSKVPVKNKKSPGAGSSTASSRSKAGSSTAAATSKVNSKSRSAAAAGVIKIKGKVAVAGMKKKTTGSSNRNGSSSSQSKTSSKTKSTTTASKPNKSGVSSSARNTSNSTSTSRSGNAHGHSNGTKNNGTASSSSSSHSRREANKSSEDKSKSSIPKAPVDRSTVNFPYDVRINGVSSFLNTIQKSTQKVKRLLQDECDIILECRFCKNLFRSMPNFLCHKNIYCKNMVDSTPDASSVQHLLHRSVPRAFEYNIDLTAITTDNQNQYQSTSDSLQSSNSHPILGQNTGLLLEEEDNRTRSSSTFLAQINQSSSSDSNPQCAEESGGVAKQKVCLVVEPVQNRKDGVVFQRRVDYPESTGIDIAACDSSASISDIREVVDRDTAILGPDGKVMCTGTSKGIEKIVRRLTAQIEITQNQMVRNSTNTSGFPGSCDICKTMFTSEKAYRQHKRDAPDCGGQSSTFTRTPHKTDDQSNLIGRNSALTNEEAIREDQSRKAFVKKLFAPQSPYKSSSEVTAEILQSPLKSPLFAKKLLQSSSPRTSPYKKVLSKAVKQIRQPDAASPSRLASPECSPLKSVSNYKPFPFFCILCSRGFKTTNEMSVHVAKCTGRFCFSEPRTVAQRKVGQRKIGIEIRRSYFETSSPAVPLKLNEHDYASSAEVKQCITTKNSVDRNTPENQLEDVASNGRSIPNLCLLRPADFSKNLEANETETTHIKESMDYSPTLSNDIGKENESSHRSISTENNNNHNIGSSSSESEGDRESISNKTDSGVSFSSATAISDDQEESRSTDLENLESSISEASKSGKDVNVTEQIASVIPSFKRKRKSSVGKVLHPNSTSVSLKRKSHRIRSSKSKTLSENEGSEVDVASKK